MIVEKIILTLGQLNDNDCTEIKEQVSIFITDYYNKIGNLKNELDKESGVVICDFSTYTSPKIFIDASTELVEKINYELSKT